MGQAKGFMVGEQDDGLESENFDFEDDNEIEVAKIKIGNNCVVVVDEPKNEDAFFMVLYNKPLHRCMETFSDGWGNIWYEGEILLGGLWYKRTT
jgi:hypothetical protein